MTRDEAIEAFDEVPMFDMVVAPPSPPPPPPPEPMSADRRRTQRQAEQIAAGLHPLLISLGRPNWLAKIHPQASTDASREDARSLPFTCGTCRFREVQEGRNRPWPKCALPDDRGAMTRVTGGPATDVRAWWPACRDYEPKED